MLILTRRRGERIQLNEEIAIVVLEIRGAQVRVGIQAPEGVKILREELLAAEKKKDETH
jgi:carbon storage regulator